MSVKETLARLSKTLEHFIMKPIFSFTSFVCYCLQTFFVSLLLPTMLCLCRHFVIFICLMLLKVVYQVCGVLHFVFCLEGM